MNTRTAPADDLPPGVPAARPIPCPGCGYDLRALAAARCPECGLEIDLSTIYASEIPWAYRRRDGYVRAYLRTAWRFIRGSRALRDEALCPQDVAAGRAFARVTGTILAALAVAIWFTVVAVTRGRIDELIAFQPVSPLRLAQTGPERPAWWDDLCVPWSAGATLPGVLPLGLALIGFHLAGAQRTVFRARGPVEARRAAVALGSFASAPLLLLVPAALLYGGALRLAFGNDPGEWTVSTSRLGAVLIVAFCLGFLCYLGALIGTFLRVGQWVARTTGGGPTRVLLALVELAVLWGLGIGLFAFALPWGVGFVRIVIDSFR